jgi:hypothetical protein
MVPMLSRAMVLFTIAGLAGAGVGVSTAAAQVSQTVTAEAPERESRAAEGTGPYELRFVAEPFPELEPLAAPDSRLVAGPAALAAHPGVPGPTALQERERFPQGVALVAAGTALIITGSLINDTEGAIVVLGGAGIVALGVYRLLR